MEEKSKKTDKKINLREIARLAVFLAFALILSLLENMLPPIVPVLPYAKIGLSNIVVFGVFIIADVKQGLVVLVLKCVLAALFSGNIGMLMYSLPAAAVSYTAIILLYKTKFFGIPALSAAGGILHNLTQLAVAAAIIGPGVFIYFPYLLLAGAAAGLATGTALFLTIKYIPMKALVYKA